MAEQWQIRRGTTTQNNAFTGANGEVTLDTERKELHIHDGTTMGGIVINREYKTNCITEIPQDIKLELTSGTLTLKAGSKIYVPNGTDTFDELTISTDITRTYTSLSNVLGIAWVTAQNTLEIIWVNYVYSGTTAPTGNTYMLWYDTANNYVKFTSNSGSTWQSGHSLPIAIVYGTSSGITRIDQVFNGFGYIGSTVFVLPGVKGLIPNGRNADGTLNNTPFYVENVLTKNPEAGTTTIQAVFTINGSGLQDYSAYQEKHDFTNNYNYAGSNKINRISFAYCTVTGVSRKISNFRTKLAFDVVNHNDIANLAMPSNRYLDLTLGSSGASYTAPADGYIFIAKTATAAAQQVRITNDTANFSVEAIAVASSSWCRCFIPVSKGNSYTITYNTGGATQAFKFIYANGAV